MGRAHGGVYLWVCLCASCMVVVIHVHWKFVVSPRLRSVPG